MFRNVDGAVCCFAFHMPHQWFNHLGAKNTNHVYAVCGIAVLHTIFPRASASSIVYLYIFQRCSQIFLPHSPLFISVRLCSFTHSLLTWTKRYDNKIWIRENVCASKKGQGNGIPWTEKNTLIHRKCIPKKFRNNGKQHAMRSRQNWTTVHSSVGCYISAFGRNCLNEITYEIWNEYKKANHPHILLVEFCQTIIMNEM